MTNPKPQPKEKLLINDRAAELNGKMKEFGGSKSDDWNNILVNQAINAQWFGNSELADRNRQVTAAIAMLGGLKPADELEAMMGAQLFAAHCAAMECYRRAMIKEQPADLRAMNLNQANKLSRTYATLIEALNRHRGKGGQQKVTVEHVHVHEGGQAAIGTFNAPGAGGGVASRNEGQTHAKPNADAPEPALLCANPLGNVLPIPSNAERQVSHARRKEPRSAEG